MLQRKAHEIPSIQFLHLFPREGVLGDCWLLSTCAALAKKEELLFRVIDPKQVPGQNQSNRN